MSKQQTMLSHALEMEGSGILTLTYTHKDLFGRKSVRTITSGSVYAAALQRHEGASLSPLLDPGLKEGNYQGIMIKFRGCSVQGSPIKGYEEDIPTGLYLPAKKIELKLDPDAFVQAFNSLEL